jgi:hypothetical protein
MSNDDKTHITIQHESATSRCAFSDPDDATNHRFTPILAVSIYQDVSLVNFQAVRNGDMHALCACVVELTNGSNARRALVTTLVLLKAWP